MKSGREGTDYQQCPRRPETRREQAHVRLSQLLGNFVLRNNSGSIINLPFASSGRKKTDSLVLIENDSKYRLAWEKNRRKIGSSIRDLVSVREDHQFNSLREETVWRKRAFFDT